MMNLLVGGVGVQVVVDGVEDVDQLDLCNEQNGKRSLIQCKEFKPVTACDAELFVQFANNRATVQVLNCIIPVFAKEAWCALCSALNAAHSPGGSPGVAEQLNV